MCYKWAHTMSFKSTHIKFFPFPFPFSSTETHFVVIIFYECALLFGAYCFWLYSKCIYVTLTVTKLAWRSLAILVQYSYDDHIQMCARLGWLWLACIVTVLDILIIAFVRTVRSITFEINPYSPSPPTHSHWSYNELSVCDETVYRCVWVTFAFAEI